MYQEYFEDKFAGVELAKWIEDLESSDSRLHKEDVIKRALVAAKIGSAEAQAFLFNCKLAYNPYETFNVKKVAETENVTGQSNPWPEFWSLCWELRNRQITGNAARDKIVAVSNKFNSLEWNKVARRVLIKDLRSGISDKTLNKILKKTEWEVPVFTCQLATDSNGRPDKMQGKKRLEQKLDGVRVLAVVNGIDVTLYSRNGKQFDNFPKIQQALYSIENKLDFNHRGAYVLDGEIMGESFQALMKQAQRKKDVDTQDMVYNVFDIIPLVDFERGYWNAQQYKRFDLLDKNREILESTGCIRVMQGIDVDLSTADGHATLKNYANQAVLDGFEGIMIKDLEAPYECKRSTFWMKWKPVHDYDLKVVAVEEGTGKNEGRMGALVCEGVDDGKHIRVNVGSGYTDEQRDEYWKNRDVVIGQTAVVLCDAITQNQNGDYSLRFPRFKTFRDDK